MLQHRRHVISLMSLKRRGHADWAHQAESNKHQPNTPDTWSTIPKKCFLLRLLQRHRHVDHADLARRADKHIRSAYKHVRSDIKAYKSTWHTFFCKSQYWGISAYSERCPNSIIKSSAGSTDFSYYTICLACAVGRLREHSNRWSQFHQIRCHF